MHAPRGPRALVAALATLVAGGVLLGTPVRAPAAVTSLAAASTSAVDDGPDARIVSLRPTADGGVRVVSDVTLPAADAPTLVGGPDADTAMAEVSLGTADGTVLRRTAPVASTIRAELPLVPGDTRLTGERVTDPAPVLRVRVPVGADLRSVAVRVDGERHAAPYSTSAERAAAPAPTPVSLPSWTLGPSSNRLDVVVLGDGYTAAQQADFVRDATAVADDVFGVTPFAEYRDFVNVVGLFVPSAQSGADQPPSTSGCSDTSVAPSCCPDAATGNPVGMVDTRYDSTFCSQGIQRLLVPTDMDAVYRDADAGFPAWEQVLMVVNDTEYGGSGGAIATTSTNEFGTDVMSHELGHSLLGLDDEYDVRTPGYPDCSDLAGASDPPCQANVTDVTTRTNLKWRRWVEDSTPIPTTTQPGSQVVGLFEGAHYSPTRWYRSCYDCLMRSLGRPLGPVGSEQLPLRLFGEAFDVGLVEPGSVTPSTAETVVVAPGETVTLSLDVLSTLPGPATKVQWYVAGQPVRTDTVGAGTVSLEVTGLDVAQEVGVSVESLPGILHPSRARAVTYQDRVWTLAPTADGRLPGEATGAPVGGGKKYVELGPAIHCDPGDLDVRLVQPRRAPRVKTIVLFADGVEIGRRRGGELPLDLVLFPDPGTTSVSALVKRRGASALTVERTYEPCP